MLILPLEPRQSVDPGLVYVNVCSEGIRVVDVKIQMTQVPRQSVMTKDNGAVALLNNALHGPQS